MEIKLPSFEGFLSTDAERIAAQENIKSGIKKIIDSANDLLVEFRKENFQTADFLDKQIRNLNDDSDLCLFFNSFIGVFPEIQNSYRSHVFMAKLRNLVSYIMSISVEVNNEQLKRMAIQIGNLFKSLPHESVQR